jgi:hypothetical protein
MIAGEPPPCIVSHAELKLIGIPCCALENMSAKYQHAKAALLGLANHMSQIKNPTVHYGLWQNDEALQRNAPTHVYILCVEVDTFDGIPDWFFRTILPPQRCVVAPNAAGNFQAATDAVKLYLAEHELGESLSDRPYFICERYTYGGDEYARYSLPLEEPALAQR